MLRQCKSSWRILYAMGQSPAGRTQTNKRILARWLSTIPESDAQNPTPDPRQDSVPPQEDIEKILPERAPRRTRIPKEKDPETYIPLPNDLNILWTPADLAPTSPNALPPPEIFADALDKLNLALHPLNQLKQSVSSLEPNLCLYCPIEGGTYVIDATVQELARRTDADVIVLDSAQLAAGEWGQFGRANPLHMSPNPLHMPGSSPLQMPTPSSASSPDPHPDDANESDQANPFISQLALHVVTRPTGSPRIMSAKSSKSSPKSTLHKFFDSVVNHSTSETAGSRPRLIYVRDFLLLSDASSTWYPALLQSVQDYRMANKDRPVTIVFGCTPPITPHPVRSQPSPPGLLQILSRSAPHPTLQHPRFAKIDWSESDAANRARERRLQSRLRKWERDDGSLMNEIPLLAPSSGSDSSDSRPDVVIVGPNGPSSLGLLSPPSQGPAGFFKTSIIVPSVRSIAEETNCRLQRRREMNDLAMRMAVGAVGGQLGPFPDPNFAGTAQVVEDGEKPVGEQSEQGESEDKPSPVRKMMEDWGNRIEEWSTIRKIADRALGSIITSAKASSLTSREPFEPTVVPWSAIFGAWLSFRLSKELRRSWIKDSTSPKSGKEMDDNEDEDDDSDEHDDIVERVRNDPDLDAHEQRLLPCIVNAESMPTSFSQVHLPPHTIDSIRTIVSLPLLYPHAFQHGILKDYGINGCLLFGPPGTGKTLLVRALAKEAGCQMLVISPSDVMDMFVGEGEKMVKAVFSLARRLSPCVVFLDEIDALFGARVSREHSGSAAAHRGVITEFMQEMDGLMTSTDDAVIVIGATNRPGDLDDAVLRRLPRRLLVDLPGEKEREAILRIMLRDEDLSADVSIPLLAKSTESFSGSDIKHLCVSAALSAIKESHTIPWLSAESGSTSAHQQSEQSTTAEANLSSKSQTETQPEPSASQPGSISPSETSPLQESSSQPAVSSPEAEQNAPKRTLSWRHFTKALSEITPSSSETLGSLAELRKWNDEFGEGRKERKRRQVWGKDRFGFTDKDIGRNDPRVLVPTESVVESAK